MKKLSFIFLLFLAVPLFADFSAKQVSEFGGFVDVADADLLGDKYSPDLLNVWTDMYGAITKREGYASFFSSALTEKQPVRSIYDYSKQDGTKYLITESSSSIYYSKDGTNTTILSGINNAYRYDYFTAKDYLYGSNGYNTPFLSTATSYNLFTSVNSTGAVKARYVEYWLNRSWWAGIDGQMATIWYSEYLDPTNIQPTNSLNINVQDGDVITGMLVTSDNKMKVTKTYSTWELFEESPGSFNFRNLDQKIGCLYNTTMDELNGFPIWMSHRGVELYDGQFNLLSAPIDQYMKSLRQLGGIAAASGGVFTQTTAADWGAGTSFVNVDTTTTPGTIVLKDTSKRDSVRNWFGTAMSTDGTKVTAITANSYIYISTDSGVTYTAKDSERNWQGIDMSDDGTIQSATTSDSVYVSTDSGSTWVNKAVLGSLVSIAVSSDGTKQTTVHYGGYIYVSTNTGDTWTQKETVQNWRFVDMSSDGTIQTVVITFGNIYISTDSGSTWNKKFASSSKNWWGVAVSSDGTKQTGVTNSGYIYVSTDTGDSWSQKDSSRDWKFICMSDDGTTQSAVTHTGGVYKSLDSGDTWTLYKSGSFDCCSISANGKYLIAAGQGNNIYTLNIIDDGSFTSQSLDAGSGWGSWGSFSAGETKPSGSSINYYAVTATSTYNLTTNTAFALTNNSPIQSSVGPYINVISSFTSPGLYVFPKLNDFSINYYGLLDVSNVPVGKVFDGRYHLFVSTDNDTKYNNIDLVYQKTGDWTIFNSIHAGAACIFKDEFYTGSSDDKGMIYRQLIPNLYNDDGGAYDSYWCSKVFDFDCYANEKIFDCIWLSAKNSGDWNLNVDYRMDGTDSDWNSKSLDLDCDYGYVVSRIPFTTYEMNKGLYLQLRFGNNNADEHFMLKKFNVIYTIQPPR